MMAFKGRGRKPHCRAGCSEESIPQWGLGLVKFWGAGFDGSAILGFEPYTCYLKSGPWLWATMPVMATIALEMAQEPVVR